MSDQEIIAEIRRVRGWVAFAVGLLLGHIIAEVAR